MYTHDVSVHPPIADVTMDSVDCINKTFYNRFPYPPLPLMLEASVEPDLARIALCQEIGDWRHVILPKHPCIWIAGCGTSQAVLTALAFPEATVIASDLSPQALEVSANIAAALKIRHIDFRQESVNEVTYNECFDYVICTGVIHHNSDPPAALRRIALAMKPDGILELMVYNQHHRFVTSAFQKAVRLLSSEARETAFEQRLATVRALLGKPSGDGLMVQTLRYLKGLVDVELADVILQPVEYSYTIPTLNDMLESARLKLLAPCVNPHDKASNRVTWDCRFSDNGLQESYNDLPDVLRWEIANLLWFENSPMLWFYCGRRDGSTQWRSQQEICSAFMDTVFSPFQSKCTRYMLRDGHYQQLSASFPYPVPVSELRLRSILTVSQEHIPMRHVLTKAGISGDFATVNEMRLKLTTRAFPYLIA